MGSPVRVSQNQQALYVSIGYPEPSDTPAAYDAAVEVFVPANSSHQADHQVFTEVTKQLQFWGFAVHEFVDRDVYVGGIAFCVKLTFSVTNKQPEHELSVRERLDLNILRKIVRAKNSAAGKALIEEFTLDGTHNSTKVTITVTEGAVRNGMDLDKLRNEEGLHVTKEPNGNYTFYVNIHPNTEEGPYDPIHTANFVANELGIFLDQPIGIPERVPLYRELVTKKTQA